jgi:hypothetical protein
MKIRSFIFAGLLFGAGFACSESDNIHIKVVDDDDMYRYTATFPRSKSRLVERFINARIAPTNITSDDVLNVTTLLEDKTKFDYKATPGKVRIELDKDENSRASYHRIKKMCEDLNQIINPRK